MPLMLTCHRDSPCAAVTNITVEAGRPNPSRLDLRYAVEGRIADLVLPPVGEPAREDELWRHSCFEAFLRAGKGEGYCEFNLAPSRQWAAYRFDGYRSGMNDLERIETPRVEVEVGEGRLELRATLMLKSLSDADWKLGLSAVIEETGGNISYWALAHPPGKPDFHHSDCFALELPAA